MLSAAKKMPALEPLRARRSSGSAADVRKEPI